MVNRGTCVNNLPRVATWQCPAGSRTSDPAITSATRHRHTTVYWVWIWNFQKISTLKLNLRADVCGPHDNRTVRRLNDSTPEWLAYTCYSFSGNVVSVLGRNCSIRHENSWRSKITTRIQVTTRHMLHACFKPSDLRLCVFALHNSRATKTSNFGLLIRRIIKLMHP